MCAVWSARSKSERKAGISSSAMLCGVSGLAFAIGVYLPLSTMAALYVGGCVRVGGIGADTIVLPTGASGQTAATASSTAEALQRSSCDRLNVTSS